VVYDRILDPAPPHGASLDAVESRPCFLFAITAHLDTLHNSVGKTHITNKLIVFHLVEK